MVSEFEIEFHNEMKKMKKNILKIKECNWIAFNKIFLRVYECVMRAHNFITAKIKRQYIYENSKSSMQNETIWNHRGLKIACEHEFLAIQRY